MRKQCANCTRKHLAQASVLVDEAANGYPQHKWLAIGHMAEAEAEWRECAEVIRESRLLYQDSGIEPNFLYLMEQIND